MMAPFVLKLLLLDVQGMAPEKGVVLPFLDAFSLNFFVARGHIPGRRLSLFPGFGAL